MNLLRLSVIGAVVLLSLLIGSSRADQSYLGDRSKTTKVTPTVASLDATTTIKRGRHHKKTKPTLAPAGPSTAALETTIMATASQLPVDKITSTLAPMLESTAAPLAMTTTKRRGPKKPKKTPATLPPVDYDCKGKKDGYFSDPKDKCSQKYYSCVGGLARQMSCPANLVFDADMRVPACVRHDESFRCSGIRQTTLSPSATTSRRPLPPPEKLPIDCSTKEDGWFANPENKCSHIFFSCSGGNGRRFECAANKYFDELWSRCLDREDVEACGGKRPVSTTAAPTSPAPITTKSPMDCAEKPSGYYPDPENKCSHVYYSCSNGDSIKMSCPPGDLYYDPSTGLCEHREDNFACTGKTKPPPTTTVAPKPSPASLPSEEFNCTGKPDGGHTPEGKKCSSKFFKCTSGVAIKMTCPKDHDKDTFYDVDSDKCLRHDELTACSNRPIKPKPTTLKPKSTVKCEPLPIDCKLKKDGDYADPEKKCSRVYYSCSGMVGSRRACAGVNTRFDEVLGLCDDRNIVPACTGKPRPLTTRRPRPHPTKPAEKITFDCTNKNGWFADDKKKCSNIYYACVGGKASRETCASKDTFYDVGINQCGYRENVPDCGGIRPIVEEDDSE